MGLFDYTGVCPICEQEVNRENKSINKYNGTYVCKGCIKNIKSKSIEAVQYLHLKDIEYLRELISTPPKSFKEQLKEANTKALINKKIVKTTILNTINDSRKKAGSTLVRGAVGASLFGVAGLAAGAMSGKNKITSQTTFLIEYASGKKETKTVDNNSKEYKELCQYL